MIGYFLDDNGYIKYIDFVDDDTKGNFTTVELPSGLNKPKFNGTEWIDDMTDDELRQANSLETIPDPTQQQLAFLTKEIASLKQEKTALQQIVMAQNTQIAQLKGAN